MVNIWLLLMIIIYVYDVVNDGWLIIIWLVVDLPLWKMMEFVSWDDEIPNWMEK